MTLLPAATIGEASAGYGTLIAADEVYLAQITAPVDAGPSDLDGRGVEVTTPVGAVRAAGRLFFHLDRGAGREHNQATAWSGQEDASRHAGLASHLDVTRDFLEIVEREIVRPRDARDRNASRPAHRCLPHPPIRSPMI